MKIKTKTFLFILFFSLNSFLEAFDFDSLTEREMQAVQNAFESKVLPGDKEVLESLAKKPVPLAQRLLAGIILHEEDDDNLRVSASWYIISAKNGIQESRDFIESLIHQPLENLLAKSSKEQLVMLLPRLKSYKEEYKRLSSGEEVVEAIDLSFPQTVSYPAQIIANYIVCAEHLKSEPEEPNGEITNLRLQKLFYEAQGLHLALYGKSITVGDGVFEGWPYGPVERSVYNMYEKYKKNPISKPNKRYFDPESVNPVTRRFLDFIVNEYGKYSTWYLSQLTHAEGGPWSISTEKGTKLGGKREKGPIISTLLLREHFSKQTDKLERLKQFLLNYDGESSSSDEEAGFKAKRSK
jgi:uncharacterized phage-associated protein